MGRPPGRSPAQIFAAGNFLCIQAAAACCSCFPISQAIQNPHCDLNTSLQVDINFQSTIGVKNSQLLRNYCSCCSLLRPLVLVVKGWARHHNINDASKCTLSSFSLSLMCVHLLQAVASPPLLPVLPPPPATATAPPPATHAADLGKLLLLFFEYYGFTFDFADRYISIASGSSQRRSALPEEQRTAWLGHSICIEEPIEKRNVSASV